VSSETASVPVPPPRGWVVSAAATDYGEETKFDLDRDRRRVIQPAHTIPSTIYHGLRLGDHTGCIGLMSQIDLGAMTELRVNLNDLICPISPGVLRKWSRFDRETIETTLLGECVLHLPVVRWSVSRVNVETRNAETRSTIVTPNVTELESTRTVTLVQRLSLVFELALEEEFEDGTDSNFSRALDAFSQIYGNAAISALENILDSGQTNSEVAGEALRWLGKVQDDQSKIYRLTILRKSLKSSSVRQRYAAALGLAAMDDPSAIPFLSDAVENEEHDKIRKHFQLVLEQLQQTGQCHNY